MYLIYCATSPTGKCYVGQTKTSLKRRIYYHQRAASGCVALREALVRHGFGSFVWEVLESGLTAEEALQREAYWIDLKGAMAPGGYNLRPAALGLSESPEWLRKNRAGSAARSLRPEWRAANLKQLRAMHASPEWRSAVVTSNKRLAASDEWRTAHAEGVRRRSSDPAWLKALAEGQMIHPVLVVAQCVQMVLEEGFSRSEVARKMGVSRPAVSSWVLGRYGWSRHLQEFFPEKFGQAERQGAE